MKKIVGYLCVIILSLSACHKTIPKAPKDDAVLDGMLDGLTNEQKAQFLRGDANVNEIFTAASGLGSVFVSNNCISCHSGDGKGHPSTALIRFGQSDSTGNRFLNQGGPQLQNNALPGFEIERLPAGAPYTKLVSPAFTGLGFLQALSDQSIIAMADPNDLNGDGISGVPSWVEIPSTVTPSSNSISINGKYICRFGKKASAYDLLHQTVNAFNQDMGITSVFDSKDVYSGIAIDPEISTQKINDIVHYLKTLKAPIQRLQDDADVIYGKSVFISINCEGCHKMELKTAYSPITALSNKIFYPYTDLLLHDMGAALDDGYTEGGAKTFEWKTPALWGLGLSPQSQGGNYFLMHDGSANSIEAAILLHGGEATMSKNKYEALNALDKAALLKFLNSL
jgi:CxxC motif-containing protein (DUF1111 family)